MRIPYDHEYKEPEDIDPSYDREEGRKCREWRMALKTFPKDHPGPYTYRLVCFNDYGAGQALRRERHHMESCGWVFKDGESPVITTEIHSAYPLLLARRLDFCWTEAVLEGE
ncbi:MAG: hypothetical protein Q8P59_07365 [Dehalococcoidia bacterium]|nr:hypothetical protein [Dehalococcoidia bacterium]